MASLRRLLAVAEIEEPVEKGRVNSEVMRLRQLLADTEIE